MKKYTCGICNFKTKEQYDMNYLDNLVSGKVYLICHECMDRMNEYESEEEEEDEEDKSHSSYEEEEEESSSY